MQLISSTSSAPVQQSAHAATHETGKAAHQAQTVAADQAQDARRSAPPAGTGKVLDIRA